jgi:hypothetical protein
MTAKYSILPTHLHIRHVLIGYAYAMVLHHSKPSSESLPNSENGTSSFLSPLLKAFQVSSFENASLYLSAQQNDSKVLGVLASSPVVTNGYVIIQFLGDVLYN